MVFQTRLSYTISNGIGIIKVLTLVFIAVTGWVVLGGHTKAHTTNFDDSFASTSTTPYGLTNALYKIVYSYSGYENAFNVVNETRNPVKRLRTYGFISIYVVAVLYILANVAYFAAGKLFAVYGLSSSDFDQFRRKRLRIRTRLWQPFSFRPFSARVPRSRG